MSGVKCYLVCLNNSHQPIILKHLVPKIIGRSSETKIKDRRCSKTQVELTANCEDFKVYYTHLGSNHGGLKGAPTKSGEKYELKHSNILELLYNEYPHKIEFDPVPSLQIQTKDSSCKGKENNHSLLEQNNSKRKRIDSSESDAKKVCSSTEQNQWETFFGNDLLVYNKHLPQSEKIAAYDMDGTLITTTSGRVFPKDVNDWRIIYAQVPGKLKDLDKKGFKIVLFTNQAGIAIKRVSVKDIQNKIANVAKKLGVPVQALVSTGKSKYRKPVTGMWDFFVTECNNDLKPDVSSSFYVGDAAGRPEIPKQRKKDHSIADRLFAINVGLNFFTPEEHFLDHKPERYTMPEFIPSSISDSTPLYNPISTKVPGHPVEVIIMVGFPGSGKSTFVEKNLLKLGYTQANRDTIGSWQKCVSVMEKSLQDKKHVVIDNTNPDKVSRERYIEVAKKLNLPVRCFVMDISLNQAKHNNKFRELTGSEHTKVNDMIYNMYKSKYEEPTPAEGFEDIVKVNFVPFFQNREMETVYKSYLLEK